MADIEVKLNFDDFYESFSGESLLSEMKDEAKCQIMQLVKKDPRYKAYIQNQAIKVVDDLVATGSGK